MARRNPSLVVGGSILGLVCVLVVSGIAYWQYANYLPPTTLPAVVMPVPNAYDDYVAAAQICANLGGALVWVQPPDLHRLTQSVAFSPPNESVSVLIAAGGKPLVGHRGRVSAMDDDAPLEGVRATVTQQGEALAYLRKGFGKQYRCLPVTDYQQAVPEWTQFRELGRVLIAEGMLAEREGHLSEAARSYLDCVRLGADVPRGGTLIHGLTGIAIEQLGLTSLKRVAGRLDARATVATAAELAHLNKRAVTVTEVLTGERNTGVITLTGRLRNTVLLIPSITKRRVLENYRRYMDAEIARARRPLGAAGPPTPIPSDPFNKSLLPSLQGVTAEWAKRDAQYQAVQGRLAARAASLGSGPPLHRAQR